MRRTLEKSRLPASIPTIQCVGCGDLCYATRSDQRYCSAPCRLRHRSAYNNQVLPRPAAREIPLTSAMIDFREAVYRVAYPECAGYRLYSTELDWWFPLEGRTLRSTGHYSDLPYYQLIRPFERPVVPIAATYDLVFCERTGHQIKSIQPQKVTINFPIMIRRVHPQLSERLARYLVEKGYQEQGPALPPKKTRGLLNR